jgi:8-oxo-dGTP diphosphatase
MFDVVVVYLLRTNAPAREVLLGRKKRGLGEGRLVGPGGKVLPGEDPLQAAIREVAEEVSITLDSADLDHRATIDYPFRGRPEHSQRSHVYLATRWSGNPLPSAELDPQWFPLAGIPWGEMWSDAALWLPRVLDGERLAAEIEMGYSDEVLTARFTDH